MRVCSSLVQADEAYHDEIFRRYRRYHGDNFNVTSHIYPLIVNMFPSFFDSKDKIFMPLKRFLSTAVEYLLIILFSPVLFFRVLLPIEKRSKLKKRKMIEDGTAAELLNRVRLTAVDNTD